MFDIKNHTFIYEYINDREQDVLAVSFPFGQFYFFLIFFLWFKPWPLITVITIYNIIIIPVYISAIISFLNGFEIFGSLLKIHEGAIRMMYMLILFLKIFKPAQFKSFFKNNS